MEKGVEVDQFQLLEEKVDSLIRLMGSYKQEKESLVEKINIQEEKIAELTGELNHLKAARDMAKKRIVALLEKIEQIEM